MQHGKWTLAMNSSFLSLQLSFLLFLPFHRNPQLHWTLLSALPCLSTLGLHIPLFLPTPFSTHTFFTFSCAHLLRLSWEHTWSSSLLDLAKTWSGAFSQSSQIAIYLPLELSLIHRGVWLQAFSHSKARAQPFVRESKALGRGAQVVLVGSTKGGR